MTKHGFYSIVQKQPGEFHIRSRVRQDLENLVQRVPLTGARIHDTTGADYSFRVIAGKDEVLAVMEFLGNSLDYSNFKSHIDSLPNQAERHGPYSRIWGILSEAFGAYGRTGKLNSARNK